MNHRRLMHPKLEAFQAGDLSEREHARIAEHIAGCADCADRLRQIETTDRLLRNARPEPQAMRPEAAQALFQRALAETRAAHRPPNRSFPALAWGMAAMAALAGVLWLRGLTERTVKPPNGEVAIVKPSPIPNKATQFADAQPGLGENERSRKLEIAAEKKAAGAPRRTDLGPAQASVEKSFVRSKQRRLHRRRLVQPKVEILPLTEPAEEIAEAAPKEPRLLVIATGVKPMLAVEARAATEETPGYARASSWQPMDGGGLMYAQYTVSSDETRQSDTKLVLASNERERHGALLVVQNTTPANGKQQ